MTLSSERLEQESEQTRLRLAESLDELRARLSPGQVVDQLVDYASEAGAGEFVRNLGRDVRQNPLPVTLIGAGIGWLMMMNGRSHSRDDDNDDMGDRLAAGMASASDPHAGTSSSMGRRRGSGFRLWGARRAVAATTDRMRAGADIVGHKGRAVLGTVSDTASDAAETAREQARTAGSAVTDAGRRARGWVSDLAGRASSSLPSSEDANSLYQSAAGTVSSAASAASSTAQRLGDSASQLGQRFGGSATELSRSMRSFAQFCVEQPLVVAGLGLAVGTALGAILPSSETEDEMLGAASANLKEKVKDQASELYGKAASVAQETINAAGQAAEKAGLTGGADSRSADDVAERMSESATSPATAG
jgi:ElaB/YqjD/DUF883 family membrane-anchored ribosome-binding protein